MRAPLWRRLWADEGGWIPLALMAGGMLGKLFGGGAKASAQGRQQEAALNIPRDQLAQNAWKLQEQGGLDRWGLQERGGLDRWNLQDRGAMDRAGLKQSGILTALGLGEQGAMGRAGLDLARRQFALNAPQTRAKSALTGDMLARGTNVNISHPRATIPKISGGYTFNDMGPDVRQAGSAMSRQALMGMLEGDKFDPVPMQDFMGSLPEVPGMAEMPGMQPMPGMAPMPGITPTPKASGWEKFGAGAGMIGSILDIISKLSEGGQYEEYRGNRG